LISNYQTVFNKSDKNIYKNVKQYWLLEYHIQTLPLEKTGVWPLSCSRTLAALVRRSPLSPTEMLSTSFCTLISLIGFDSFFSEAYIIFIIDYYILNKQIRRNSFVPMDVIIQKYYD
jgi:hypothetical protein